MFASENPIIRFAVSAAFSPLHQCLRNTRMERYGLLRGLRLAHSDYAINNRARHAHGPSGEVDVAPLQSKQFTLSQAGRRSEKHKRPFSNTKDVYQGLDFNGRKQTRRLPPFGTLTDELDGVVVMEFVPTSMVEENRHQISEFSAGTSCQRKMPKPGLDFDRSNPSWAMVKGLHLAIRCRELISETKTSTARRAAASSGYWSTVPMTLL
jgi:hypothetical protein